MSLEVEPLEKKRKRKTKSSSSAPSSSQSISFIPDEIVVTCLARISRFYYPKLSIVSKRFRSILASTELYAERSLLGNTEQCLYFCVSDNSHQYPQWFTLCLNPNRTLPKSMTKKKKKKQKKKRTGKLFVRIPSSNISDSSVAVVGSEIYSIGGLVDGAPSSAVRILDCRSHTWRDAPSVDVARKNASSCVYNGKIYVLGGCEGLKDDEPWTEVFDTKSQTWEGLSDPDTEIRKCCISRIKEIEGKIKLETAFNMYAYDTKQGKWEYCGNKNATILSRECEIENVSYSFGRYTMIGPNRCLFWYDINDGNWKEVKGLDSPVKMKQIKNGWSRSIMTTLASCSGRLLAIWEKHMKHIKKIWCAEIAVEKRDGGEVWGNVEWIDVLHTIPRSCLILHCLDVSV